VLVCNIRGELTPNPSLGLRVAVRRTIHGKGSTMMWRDLEQALDRSVLLIEKEAPASIALLNDTLRMLVWVDVVAWSCRQTKM